MGAFKLVKRSDLTRQQVRDAIRAMSAFKGKRDGSLKVRTCADGRKQRGWHNKQEIISPTVHNKSIMMVTIIK